MYNLLFIGLTINQLGNNEIAIRKNDVYNDRTSQAREQHFNQQ